VRFTFYVVNEAALPPAATRGTAAATPEAVIAAIRERGGRWTQVGLGVDAFAKVFETIERFTGTSNLLPNLAFTGSPQLLLTARPGTWRLGYFEASLVPHLHAVLQHFGSTIDAAMEPLGDDAEAAFAAFRSALAEAAARGFAVAILHE